MLPGVLPIMMLNPPFSWAGSPSQAPFVWKGWEGPYLPAGVLDRSPWFLRGLDMSSCASLPLWALFFSIKKNLKYCIYDCFGMKMNINFNLKDQFFFQLEKKLKHSCEPLEILWTAGTLSNEEPWGLGPFSSLSLSLFTRLIPDYLASFLTSPPVKPHPMLCYSLFHPAVLSLTGVILICEYHVCFPPLFTCLLSDSPVRV